MKYGIILSKKDPVARTALLIFLEQKFKKVDDGVFEKDGVYLIEREEDVLYLEGLDDVSDRFGLEYLVVVSRHSSAKQIRSLSVHPTGNFGTAKYGGRDKELSYTFANGMHRVFIELLNRNPGDYQVTLEVTHHGPTQFKTPLFFAEVGSTEKEWTDPDAVEALVRSILEGNKRKKKTEVAVGFGGGHYAPKFTPLEETIAFGHICAKYNAGYLDESMVSQMIQKVWDGVDFAVIDEKGLKGQQRRDVKEWLNYLGVEYQVV